jgi:hypothetical protein
VSTFTTVVFRHDEGPLIPDWEALLPLAEEQFRTDTGADAATIILIVHDGKTVLDRRPGAP